MQAEIVLYLDNSISTLGVALRISKWIAHVSSIYLYIYMGKACIHIFDKFIALYLFFLQLYMPNRLHHPFVFLVSSILCCQYTCNSPTRHFGSHGPAPQRRTPKPPAAARWNFCPTQGPLQSCCPSTLGERLTQQLAGFLLLLRTSWIDLAAPFRRFSFSSPLSPQSIILSLLHDLLFDGETIEDSTPFSAQN